MARMIMLILRLFISKRTTRTSQLRSRAFLVGVSDATEMLVTDKSDEEAEIDDEDLGGNSAIHDRIVYANCHRSPT